MNDTLRTFIAIDSHGNTTTPITNLNVNAFNGSLWTSDNFPTTNTETSSYYKWDSKINAKGWYLLRVLKYDENGIINNSKIPQRYKLYFSNTQQTTTTVFNKIEDIDNIPPLDDCASVEGFVVGSILTISLTFSYLNCFKVDEIDIDNRYIIVSIVNSIKDPFDEHPKVGTSPYYKGACLITGMYNVNKQPYEMLTNEYVSNGVVNLSYNSSSFGDCNVVAGYNSTAFGPDHNTYEAYSTTLGNNNTVCGYSSCAIGQANTVYGEKSFAVGAHNKMIGSFGSTLGHQNSAIIQSELQHGVEWACSGCLVAGNRNYLNLCNNKKVGFPSNIVLGLGLSSIHPTQTILGRYNNNQEDSILEIGWGSSAKDPKNVFRINKNGYICLPIYENGKRTNDEAKLRVNRVNGVLSLDFV